MTEQSMTRPRAPSLAEARHQVRHFVELWLGAMFLKREIYTYERDRKNPFGSGLLYIAVVGVVVALAGILGAGLRFATSPTAQAIENTILGHLHAMPFYDTVNSGNAASFDNTFAQIWNAVAPIALGYPINATGFVTLVASLLTTPLGLVIGWLIYGALVHLIARGWNPETSFGEMLAPLALASSPQLLNVLAFLPNAGPSGAAVALWTFVCNVFAIRIAYQTTTRRAVWAAFFPILLEFLLILLLVILVVAFFIPVSRTIGGPQ